VSLFQPHNSLSTSKSQLALKRVRGVVDGGVRVVRVLAGTKIFIIKIYQSDIISYLVLLVKQYHQLQYQMIVQVLFDLQEMKSIQIFISFNQENIQEKMRT
jgi:hypothetical protein